MSLTDVINPQVGLGLMLSANSWVLLVNLSPKKVTLSLLQRIAWIVNNKYKWDVPLYLKSTRFLPSTLDQVQVQVQVLCIFANQVLKYIKYW